MNKKTENAWKIYQNQQDLIRFFDTKINFLLIFNGIMTTYFLSRLDKINYQNFQALAFIFYIISFFVFIYFTIKTIFPRIPKRYNYSVPKLIFFKDIALRNQAEEYKEDFIKVSDVDFENDLYYQIYELAAINESKSKNFKCACILLIINFISFILFILCKNL